MQSVKKQTWRDYYNPTRGLSLPRFVAMEDQTERGQYADIQWFYRHMVKSDVTIIAAVSPTAQLRHYTP